MNRSNRRRPTLFSQMGSSIPELMVTVGIIASVMGTGVMSLDRGYLDLATAKQTLVNDLRRARMQATLKGAHFRFQTQGGQYVITRLKDADGDGVWNVDSAYTARTVELPHGYSIVAASTAEFDGRGLLVATGSSSVADIISVTLRDHEGQRKVVQIWPSGQVEEAI